MLPLQLSSPCAPHGLLFSDIFVLSSTETWMRHLSKEYKNNRYVRLLKAKGMPQI